MRILRPFLTLLAIVLGLAVLLVVATFSPVVQTWYVERMLARLPGVQANVESVSAGFSSVALDNVRLERGGAVLRIPHLEATLPVLDAVRHGTYHVTHLVARGWTLDLTPHRTGGPAPAAIDRPGAKPDAPMAVTGAASPPPDFVQEWAGRLQRLLATTRLPEPISLDGLQLEGDIVVASPLRRDPAVLHLVLGGGGLSAGHGADFAVDASGTVAEPGAALRALAVRGRVGVETAPSGALRRVRFTGAVASDFASVPDGVTLTLVASAADAGQSEQYLVEFTRGTHPLARLTGHLADSAATVSGTWQIDVAEPDFAALTLKHPLPFSRAAGQGAFDCDTRFERIHASGHLRTETRQLNQVVALLHPPDAVVVEADFDALRRGPLVTVNRLTGAISEAKPVATVQALQPFTLDTTSGGVTTAKADAEWLAVNLLALPWQWLPVAGPNLTITGGDVAGDGRVTMTNGALSFRSVSPLVTAGVSVRHSGAVVAQALDLSVQLAGQYTREKGWTLRGNPLSLDAGGRRLATAQVTFSPTPDDYGRVAVSGTWTADLDAWRTQPAVARAGWLKGAKASGELTAHLGAASDISGKIVVDGHAAGHGLSASLQVSTDDYNGAAFQVPLTVTVASASSDFLVEGTWKPEAGADRVEAQVSSKSATAAHLNVIAAALPLAEGRSLADVLNSAAAAPTSARDPRPFWGDVVGRVRFDFRELHVGPQQWNDLGATLGISHDALQLNGGRAVFSPPLPPALKVGRAEVADAPMEPRSRVTLDGTLSYDHAADRPYALKADATVDVIETARLLGPATIDGKPLLEGRWGIAASVSGTGRNLADVIARREERMKLTSTGGAVRLLKADVAAALPEARTPVSDSVASVGSAVGRFFGATRAFTENKLSKETEAVLEFSYTVAELPYEQITVTALRQPDGPIRLEDIAIRSKNERLTGTGEIAHVRGAALGDRPLTLQLVLGVRGIAAERLATAGLLSSDRDGDGFVQLRAPVRFGGTLAHVDSSPWRDLLAKAALPPAKK